MGQIEKHRFVTEGHSVDFFVNILWHGHCLNILGTVYKEFHSHFQIHISLKRSVTEGMNRVTTK